MVKMDTINEKEQMQQVLTLFRDKKDLDGIKSILDAELGKIPMGMTEYQINNFVLNEREFCTPLMQYQQAKMELFTRVQGFVDSYYQLREAQAKIKLAEGEIEDLVQQQELNTRIREARIELQQIEIEKNRFKIDITEKQAKEKLRESLVFYRTYKKHRNLENLKPEEIAKIEEEGWRIKSAYYPELPQRYNLTPKGRLPYPHEEGGLKLLEELQDQQEKLVPGKQRRIEG